jgi:hypothetical protein
MADEPRGRDAAAVLDIVHAYFTSGTGRKDLLRGPLHDWADMSTDLRPVDRFEREYRLEHAEILDLGPSSAVVDVRADEIVTEQGRRAARFDYSGPVLLERLRGDWRIVDFALNGARRLDGIATGLLAEQEQAGVVARVLGIDRGPGNVLVVIELENDSPGEIALERALIRAGRLWTPAWIVQPEPIGRNETSRVLLAAREQREVGRDEASVALVVAAGTSLPFLMHAPLGDQPRPWRGAAPKNLPLRLRATLPVFVSANVLVTALLAWQFGWLALLIPIAVGAQFFRAYVSASSPPNWFQRFRIPFAVALAAAATLLFWNTALVQFALPSAVALASYVVLRRADRTGGRRVVVASVAIGAAFFFLLGTGTKPLSPCRLLGDDPGAPADAFTWNMLVGNLEAARRQANDALADTVSREEFLISPQDADAAVRNRSGPERCDALFVGSIPNCFIYPVRTTTGASYTVETSAACDGRRWRVNSWSHG